MSVSIKTDVRSNFLAQHPGLELCAIYDCEAEAENPVEAKYRKLAHDKIRGVMDPNLKVMMVSMVTRVIVVVV